ncbi:MAG: ATP-binding cassette domain-containing protein [Caldiserica bacterium]|nr:ATP-binding cassette domain-containing protein [Caldisericota bacterium]
MIEIRDLEKIYPNGTTALTKINLTIEKGEFVYVVGESGAGKTTLLKILHGEECSTTGYIKYLGKDIRNIPSHTLKRKISFSYQDFMLIEDRTVFENITLPLQFIGESLRSLASKSFTILEAMKLKDKMYKLVKELSGGEKQRISIARAIIANPEVILLDEPFGNLDKETAEKMMPYIEALNEKGTTIIMATHHMLEENSTPKRIIKLKKGRIINKEYV